MNIYRELRFFLDRRTAEAELRPHLESLRSYETHNMNERDLKDRDRFDCAAGSIA